MDLIGKMYKKIFKVNVIYRMKGRIRVNIPHIREVCDTCGVSQKEITEIINLIKGINKAEFNPITENILILYDETITKENEIIHSMKKIVDILISNREELMSEKLQDFNKVLQKIKSTLS